LQEAVRAAGLNFPETKLCDGSHPGDGEWLHKTGQGGNGSGVSRLPSEPPTVGYFQHFVPGESGSAIYVDGELRGITRQLIKDPFQYSGTLAPWKLSSDINEDFQTLGRMLSTMGLRGLFGVDFVFDGNQPWIIEVNPRVTAAVEIVEQVTGGNLLAEHLGSYGVRVEALPRQSAPAAGKVILYAKQALVISPATSEQLLGRTGSLEAPLLADIPHAGTEISVGEPILTVFARGATLENVEQDLRRQVLALENELYTESVGRHT
jgi:predicted ATP-grasp superfamily ATP-dependent carboligase